MRDDEYIEEMKNKCDSFVCSMKEKITVLTDA